MDDDPEKPNSDEEIDGQSQDAEDQRSQLDRLTSSEDDSNVIRMPTLAERDRMRREKEKQARAQQKAQKVPFFGSAVHGESAPQFLNIPFVTKTLLIAILAIHIVVDLVISDAQYEWVVGNLGFVPARFTVGVTNDALWSLLLSPFTYAFIHGSWLHVIMNVVMLMAFAAGVEKWLGPKKMFLYFMLCSLAAVFFHFVFDTESYHPVVGASGGLSGLFAGVMIMMYRQGAIGRGKYGLWPFIALWIGISVIFGYSGSPDGNQIAWLAHLGGFLAGFALLKPVMSLKI